MSTLEQAFLGEKDTKPSLVDAAYDALKAAIRNSEFPPGHQASEQEVASQLSMSRTPVHEAIIRLQEDGLVRVLSRRSVVICAFSPSDMSEIYGVIIAVEGAAAALLAEQIYSARMSVIQDLARFNSEMAAALDRSDMDIWARSDEAFHRCLVERCGNRRLVRVFYIIMD